MGKKSKHLFTNEIEHHICATEKVLEKVKKHKKHKHIKAPEIDNGQLEAQLPKKKRHKHADATVHNDLFLEIFGSQWNQNIQAYQLETKKNKHKSSLSNDKEYLSEKFAAIESVEHGTPNKKKKKNKHSEDNDKHEVSIEEQLSKREKLNYLNNDGDNSLVIDNFEPQQNLDYSKRKHHKMKLEDLAYVEQLLSQFDVNSDISSHCTKLKKKSKKERKRKSDRSKENVNELFVINRTNEMTGFNSELEPSRPCELTKKKKHKNNVEDFNIENGSIITENNELNLNNESELTIEDKSSKKEKRKKEIVNANAVSSDFEIESEHSVTEQVNNVFNDPESDDDDDTKIKSMEQLKNLQVKVDFEIPKLHLILHNTGPYTAEQKNHVARLKLPYKMRNKFSKIEDNVILENWKNFIKKYNIANRPILFRNLYKKEVSSETKQAFLWYLSRNLPDRTPKSVFSRFKSIAFRLNKGKYTDKEMKIINGYIENRKGECMKWDNHVALARQLNRKNSSLTTKMQRILNPHTKRIKWDGEDLALYLESLIQVTGVENIEELKYRPVTSQEFRELSKYLYNIPGGALKHTWDTNIYTRLFIPGDYVIMSNVRYDLITLMYKNKEDDLNTIDWKKYVKYFDGFTTIKLSNVFAKLVDVYIEKKDKGDLKKILDILYHNINDQKLRRYHIYKVIYENGRVRDLKDVYYKKPGRRNAKKLMSEY